MAEMGPHTAVRRPTVAVMGPVSQMHMHGVRHNVQQHGCKQMFGNIKSPLKILKRVKYFPICTVRVWWSLHQYMTAPYQMLLRFGLYFLTPSLLAYRNDVSQIIYTVGSPVCLLGHLDMHEERGTDPHEPLRLWILINLTASSQYSIAYVPAVKIN